MKKGTTDSKKSLPATFVDLQLFNDADYLLFFLYVSVLTCVNVSQPVLVMLLFSVRIDCVCFYVCVRCRKR